MAKFCFKPWKRTKNKIKMNNRRYPKVELLWTTLKSLEILLVNVSKSGKARALTEI
jgi:hypothetical protein